MARSETIAPPATVQAIFNRIAPDYDRFNAWASFGLHHSWRESLVREIPHGARVLDIATGTGDVAFLARSRGNDVVGLDFSERMIAHARAKDTAGDILWMVGSADQLPFAERSFGAVTSAFALRNFRSCLEAVFLDTLRVLKSGGVALHLDFGRPRFPLMRWGHRMHLTYGIPLIGRWLCGERWPQGYLETTIEQFYEPQDVERQMSAAGFKDVSHQSIFGGVVQLYRGTKA
jgi:demethylmenaquinone methyltransferase/2-methoxy-6-polyprenyl-1,4-benzoquinol methylase